MKLTPNINGTNIGALYAQRRAVLSCARALRAALGSAYPNARDYQLGPASGFRADQVEWDTFIQSIKDFEEKIGGEVGELFDLMTERENRR